MTHLQRILILSGVTLASLAQPPEDDLRNAKLAAEAMYKVVAAGGGASRTVTGKPYSGESVTETIQTLGDGNQIIRRNTTRHYRDSDGRTRREQSIEKFGGVSAVVIVISDPVANVDFILDPARKSARKFGRLALGGSPRLVEGASLGKRTIAGVECDGARKVVTIPAGEIGNTRPIEIVTETWYSPAIDALVLSTSVDPRFGETRYALRNIVLAGPPRQLFEPPSDYKLVSEGQAGGVMKRAN